MGAEADHEAYWKAQCIALGGLVDEGDIVRIRAPQGGFPTNGILRFRRPAAEIDSELVQWKTTGAPFSWWSDNAEAEAPLSAAGMNALPAFALMERPVQDLGAPRHDVSWIDQPDDFIEVQMAAHGIPLAAREALLRCWRGLIHNGCELAVVKSKGRPIGGGVLHTGAGRAGLYAVGVLEQCRRQGVARSLLQARMRQAIDQGLDSAVATTTPDGRAFLAAHGFKEVGVLRQWIWMP